MNDFLGNVWFWWFLSMAGCMFYLAGRPQWLGRRRQRAEDGLLSALDAVVTPHIDTLAHKRRKLVLYDDYGVPNKDAWFGEIDYFLINVADPDPDFAGALDRLKRVEGKGFSPSRTSRIINNRIEERVSERQLQLPGYGAATSASPWLVEHLRPIEFEEYCAEVLRENGWRAYATKASGDQGIDVIAWRKGVKAVLQCKKYESPVGNSAVQEIVAGRGYENAQVAAVVTNAEYTPAAVDLARANEVHLLHYSDLVNFSDRIGIASEANFPVIQGA